MLTKLEILLQYKFHRLRAEVNHPNYTEKSTCACKCYLLYQA